MLIRILGEGQFELDDSRLAVTLARTMADLGALPVNHMGVTGILKDADGQNRSFVFAVKKHLNQLQQNALVVEKFQLRIVQNGVFYNVRTKH